MQMHFGEHVTIDGYEGDPVLLNDREVLVSCLTGLCEALHMHPLEPAHVLACPDNLGKDPGGWSAFVVIAESHMSIHTFPKRRFLSADVYTCHNGMNTELVAEIFKKKFTLGDIETHFLKRGVKYPMHNLA